MRNFVIFSGLVVGLVFGGFAEAKQSQKAKERKPAAACYQYACETNAECPFGCGACDTTVGRCGLTGVELDSQTVQTQLHTNIARNYERCATPCTSDHRHVVFGCKAACMERAISSLKAYERGGPMPVLQD